jgi:RNA polymerase sigma factor (sigma-70 family)
LGPVRDATDLSTYAPALQRYFRKRAAAAEVDDLVQEVFLNMQARRSSAPIDNIEGYLFSVASHVLARHRLGAKKASLFSRSAGEDDPVPVEALSPERVVLSKESLNRVVAALDALPPRTRDVFLLHRFEELTYGAIGRRLGISVSAVEKHVMNALKLLKQQLEQP